MANSNWKITNATAKKNLVVINASVDSDAPKAFYYEQSTSLVAFAAGSPLAPGNSDTIVIPDPRQDSSGKSLPYTFIIAEAETLSPIKAVSFNADLSDLADTAVDDDAVSIITTTIDFYRNISAFPGSELAVRFAALDPSDSKAIQAYFDSTDDYKSITVEVLHLVLTYYSALPYGWANGKNITIYLYGGSYTNATDTDKVRSIGTIKITNDWTLPLPLSGSDKFKIELKLNDDQAREMVFSKGAFWESAKTATAKVSLAASFGVPSQLSLSDTNDNICTFLVGSINGTDAFGMEGAAPHDPDTDGGSFFELFDVRCFRDGLTLGMYGVGIAAAIFLLVKVGQFVKWCRERGNPTVDQKERAAQTEELKEYISENIQAVLQTVAGNLTLPELADVPAVQTAYRASQLASKTRISMENIQQMVEAQVAQLAAVGSTMANTDLNQVADSLEAIRTALNQVGTTPEALESFRAQLPDLLGQLAVNNNAIYFAKTKAGSKLTSEQKEEYDRAFEVYDEIRIAQTKVNDEIKEIEARADEHEVIEDGSGTVIK